MTSGSEFEIDMDFKKKPGDTFFDGDNGLFLHLEDDEDR